MRQGTCFSLYAAVAVLLFAGVARSDPATLRLRAGPGTLWLAGAAAVGFGLVRRRRARAS